MHAACGIASLSFLVIARLQSGQSSPAGPDLFGIDRLTMGPAWAQDEVLGVSIVLMASLANHEGVAQDSPTR
jgi:hypothetical protein